MRAKSGDTWTNDLIRTAHRVGASLRQIAEASGLGRKTMLDDRNETPSSVVQNLP